MGFRNFHKPSSEVGSEHVEINSVIKNLKLRGVSSRLNFILASILYSLMSTWAQHGVSLVPRG